MKAIKVSNLDNLRSFNKGSSMKINNWNRFFFLLENIIAISKIFFVIYNFNSHEVLLFEKTFFNLNKKTNFIFTFSKAIANPLNLFPMFSFSGVFLNGSKEMV